MLMVLSPAKRLDWDTETDWTTEPEFTRDAAILAGHARGLGLGKLKALMDLSDDLARLNRDRFLDYSETPDPAVLRPAVMAFAGDTYVGLDARSLDAETLEFSQGHLRILSGLYGVLRPLDGIQPYRLEMGSRLKTRRGKTLYDFWGDRIARSLSAAADDAGTDVLVNCASQEYFGAVDLKRLGLRVITPVFMEMKAGKPTIVSFFAKRARGAMARFIIQRRLTDPEGMKDFDTGGYRYRADISDGGNWVFLRDQAAD